MHHPSATVLRRFRVYTLARYFGLSFEFILGTLGTSFPIALFCGQPFHNHPSTIISQHCPFSMFADQNVRLVRWSFSGMFFNILPNILAWSLLSV